MTPRVSAIARQLKALRLQAGLTQEELATRSGFNRSHLSNVERGLRPTTTDQLERLVDACGGVITIRKAEDLAAERLAQAFQSLPTADRERITRLIVLLPHLPAWVKEALDGDLRLWERQFLTGPEREPDPPAPKPRDQVR